MYQVILKVFLIFCRLLFTGDIPNMVILDKQLWLLAHRPRPSTTKTIFLQGGANQKKGVNRWVVAGGCWLCLGEVDPKGCGAQNNVFVIALISI